MAGIFKVIIFAREVKRVTKFKDQPSFAPTDKSKLTLSNKNGKSQKKSETEIDDSDYEEAEEEESF